MTKTLALLLLIFAASPGHAEPLYRCEKRTGYEDIAALSEALNKQHPALPVTPSQSLDLNGLKQRIEGLDSRFQCENPEPQNGLRCRIRVEGYPQPISILVPAGYQPEPQADLILHMHGDIVTGDRDREVFGIFDFGEMLTSSGQNSIMIIPESSGAGDTYAQFYGQGALQFDSVLDRVIGEVLSPSGLIEDSTAPPEERIDSITLTAHSGGRRVLSSWHSMYSSSRYLQRVQNMGLFDASFGGSTTPHLGTVARSLEQRNGVFANFYLAGSPTEAGSETIRSTYQSGSGRSVEVRGADTVSWPLSSGQSYFVRDTVSLISQDTQIDASRPYPFNPPHYQVLQRHYENFLRSL